MIDILSNPNWLVPQVDFLVFLQNIRSHCPNFINTFFLSITSLGEYILPVIISALVYWCYDSKKGIYLFSLLSLNVIISHFAKLIACVYRPWILSDKIHPLEQAMFYAKSYSFPSGHSSMSSAIFGGLAYLLKKYKFVCILLILTVLTVGFSRLWLGVHTPQDVISGFLIGFTCVFLIHFLVEWAEKNKNRYLYLLGIINPIVLAVLVYICFFNSYPTDYVDGKLLVDPNEAIYITVCIYSYMLGFLNGAFLCRRFFPFDPKQCTVSERFFRGVIGTIGIIVLLKYTVEPVFKSAEHPVYLIFIPFITGIIITGLYPLIFSKISGFKSNNK